MKKIISTTLAFGIVLSAAGALGASAESSDMVHIVVKNDKFSTADGAAWDGVLIDEWAPLSETDSMESVIENAITSKGFPFEISDYGYISSINGLSEMAHDGSGGWMATLNDWFTSSATTDYTVENGGLEANDEIVMMYTNDWGADCGSLYGDLNTSLNALSATGGTFTAEFDPAQTEYTVNVSKENAAITLTPEAYNKNYQVRVYKNEYQPEVNGAELKKSQPFEVSDGDVLYIGVGNPAWPTMNSWVGIADETVYTVNVKFVPVLGDFNGSGEVEIEDVTFLQRCLCEFETLSESQLAVADVDGNGKVDINDATQMQRIIAEYASKG